MDKFTETLEELGLNEKEAKVYLALIRRGDSPVLKISKEIGIDRTTVYDILERLMGKGIVSVYIKNKSRQFSALPPDKLLHHFRDKCSLLENILPELKNISSQVPALVKCELFSAKEGLKSVGKDIVNNAKEYRVIGIRKEYEEILGYFNEQSILKLDKLKAKEFAIVEKGAKFIKRKRGEYKYLDKKLLSPITTLIYNDKVVFFIWKEPYSAVSIENAQLARAQKEYFDLLWKAAR